MSNNSRKERWGHNEMSLPEDCLFFKAAAAHFIVSPLLSLFLLSFSSKEMMANDHNHLFSRIL